MRNLVVKALLVLVLGMGIFAHASTVQLLAPVAVPGAVTFAWGGYGDGNPFTSGTSNSIGSLTMTTTSAGSLTTFVQQPTGAFYNGGFVDGAGVLAAFDFNSGENTSSIELDFNSGLNYFSTYAESQDFGDYIVSMALYHDATLINTFSASGNQSGAGDGTAAFLGFLSTDGINRVVLSATEGGNASALAISDVTAAVPEPGSMVLLGTGLTSMIGAIRRKRQK